MDGTPASAALPLRRPRTASAPVTGPDDWDGFEAAVRLHHTSLRGFAARLLRNADRTDDVLQEAYLRAFGAFAAFDGSAAALEAWLYRIVYRCCVDEFRRARRLRLRLLERVAAEPVAVGFDLASVERLTVRSALDGLKPEIRAALVLVHWCGLDYDAAGAALGIPAGTVGSRLTTGRRALRAALEQEDDPSGGRHEAD